MFCMQTFELTPKEYTHEKKSILNIARGECIGYEVIIFSNVVFYVAKFAYGNKKKKKEKRFIQTIQSISFGNPFSIYIYIYLFILSITYCVGLCLTVLPK